MYGVYNNNKQGTWQRGGQTVQADRQTYSLSKIKKVKPKLNIIEQSGNRSTKVK